MINPGTLKQAKANPKAEFLFPNVRFTVLTPRFIRIEISPHGDFEDQPSQVFWYRNQPAPPFQIVYTENSLELETSQLILSYHYSPAGLTPENLTITLKENETMYRFGDVNPHILPGTTRTLDETQGSIQLQPGYISRSGWVLIDDTKSLVFNSTGQIKPRMHSEEYRDYYFLASGSDYKTALMDYQLIAGCVPLIPRYLLGNWWSRFWEYSQQNVKELVQKFQQHQIPLSVFALDMDWHIVETGNDCSGWTGFSWNPKLFPDPPGLLQWLHEQGLAITLNLHPAEGIYPHEEHYEELIQALKYKPAEKAPIPFNSTDKRFAQAYFETMLHPLQEDGVDFWWLDWQQGDQSDIPNLDPLWWLNHLHFLDQGRDGRKRPFIFSRWGGAGNHRYPIGFSGDTIISWESLAFQPYFTATAANAAYGWWSHDIGGHMRGTEDPELYVRWLQFGAISPILRIHSGKDTFIDHQPWAFDAEVLRLAKETLQFRHTLIPYLYTMARRNEQEGLPICTPLYYDWQKEDTAYITSNQYLFGSELMAAPIVIPQEGEIGLSRQTIWFPPGDWFDFFSGEHFRGPTWRILYKALDEISLFARTGAIIPLQPLITWGGIANPQKIDLYIFPGKNGEFILYEDNGVSTNYKNGGFCETRYQSYWDNHSLTLQIHPAKGKSELIPDCREYHFFFRGITEPTQHELCIDQKEIPLVARYDKKTMTLTLGPIMLAKTQHLSLTIRSSKSLMNTPTSNNAALIKMLKASRMETLSKNKIFQKRKDLKKNIADISKWDLPITKNQLKSIVEVITGAGSTEFTTPQDNRILILSNPKNEPHFNYRKSSSHKLNNVPQEGIVLSFPEEQNAWGVEVNYFSLFTEHY